MNSKCNTCYIFIRLICSCKTEKSCKSSLHVKTLQLDFPSAISRSRKESLPRHISRCFPPWNSSYASWMSQIDETECNIRANCLPYRILSHRLIRKHNLIRKYIHYLHNDMKDILLCQSLSVYTTYLLTSPSPGPGPVQA